MTILSIITLNRCAVLNRVLDAILATTQVEQPAIFVTDNASTDGTTDMLREREKAGQLRAWYLPENMGTDRGRNASHWSECIGHDVVRMDDKVLPLVPGWLTSLKRMSDEQHAIVGTPYDPTVMHLHSVAPCVQFVTSDIDQGRGGPLLFIPGAVTAALGACDELFPGHLYGWTDILYIERALLLGWIFGFTLRVPVEYLAQADPARRNSAMEWHGLYVERLRQYREAERDVYIPMGRGNEQRV